MRDILPCELCGEVAYSLPRYARGTGVYLGRWCERCTAIREAEEREAEAERLRDARDEAKLEAVLERRSGLRDD